MNIWLGDAKLGKKVSGHLRVIVLAGMNKTIAKKASGCASGMERSDDRGDLHEIGTGPGDEIDGRHGEGVYAGEWLTETVNDSAQGFCDVDGETAHLHQFVQWNWGWTLVRDRLDEGLDARMLTLVLAPEVHLCEFRPAEPPQLTII